MLISWLARISRSSVSARTQAACQSTVFAVLEAACGQGASQAPCRAFSAAAQPDLAVAGSRPDRAASRSKWISLGATPDVRLRPKSASPAPQPQSSSSSEEAPQQASARPTTASESQQGAPPSTPGAEPDAAGRQMLGTAKAPAATQRPPGSEASRRQTRDEHSRLVSKHASADAAAEKHRQTAAQGPAPAQFGRYHDSRCLRKPADVAMPAELPADAAARLAAVAVALGMKNSDPALAPLAHAMLKRPGRNPATWLQPAAAAELVSVLLNDGGMQPAAVLQLLAQRPLLLCQGVVADAAGVFAFLRNSLSASAHDVWFMLQGAPNLLATQPLQLRETVEYLRQLQLTPADLLELGRRHPSLLRSPKACLQANFAMLIGLGLTVGQLRDMLCASPGWATQPLHQLIAKWHFISSDMKGTVDDLHLCPQLLQCDIMQNLGPRVAFAKKHRVKVLMPSYTMGHPIIHDRLQWKEHNVVPVQVLVCSYKNRLCRVMGFDMEEYERYKVAWMNTAGTAWRPQLQSHHKQRA